MPLLTLTAVHAADTEPAGQKPGKDFTRKLDEGTFAFQAHDPGNVARYKNIRAKRLD